MNKRLAGFAAAMALFALAGAVYFTRCRHAAAPATTTAAPDATALPTPTRAHGDGDADPPPAPPPRGLPEWERDNDPRGPLPLEGQVLDAAGEPVAGALVSLDSTPRRTATSDTDGSFSFAHLIGRTYHLWARAGDLVGGPIQHRLTATSAPAVIRVGRGATVEVTVVGELDDRPVAGAAVSLDDDQHASTGADGKVSFRGVHEGFARVGAQGAGLAAAQQLVQIPPDTRTPVQVRIALRRGATIAGRVVDDRGKPIANAHVIALNAAGLYQLSRDADAISTDAAGRFTLPAVAAGTWRLRASHPDHAPGLSAAIASDGATAKRDVEIVLAAAATLAGKVVDDRGAAVPFATVRVASAQRGVGGDPGDGQALRQVSADERGAFRFAGLPRAAMRVLAIGELGASPTVEVDLAATPDRRDVVLELTILGTISGIVVDGEGQPVAEAQVSANPDLFGSASEDLALRTQEAATTNGDGAFVLHGLPPGVYTLRPSRLAAGDRQAMIAGTHASTGDTGVRLTLLADGGLSGKVAFASGGAPAAFTVTVAFPPGTPFVDTDGAFEVGRLPAGTYDVTVRGPDFADTVARDVVVAADAVTDLHTITVARGRTVSGRVVDGDGHPIAGALVVAGRQIIGDGSTLSADLGSGTDEWLGVRRTHSGDDGSYRLTGLSSKALTLAAEQPTIGRAPGVKLAAGADDQMLDLHLIAFAAVQGTVTVGGRPAPQAMIAASAKGSSEDQYAIVQASDGSFVIDKLPAGSYLIKAFVGGEGSGFASSSGGAEVTLEPGERATVAIQIEAGDVTVLVTARPKAGATLDAFQVFLLRGVVSATNAEELTQIVLGQADHKQALVSADQTARLEKVVPGSYTLCAVPITGDLNDPAFGTRLQEHVKELKVYCQRAEIAAAPLEQSIVVELPAMLPLPAN